MLFSPSGQVLAYSKTGTPLWKDAGASALQLAKPTDLGGPALPGLMTAFKAGTVGKNFDFEAYNREWIGRINKLNARDQDIYLGVLAPRDELLSDAARIRTHPHGEQHDHAGSCC